MRFRRTRRGRKPGRLQPSLHPPLADMSSAQDYTLSVTYKGRSHRFTVPFDELKQYDRVLAQVRAGPPRPLALLRHRSSA